MRIYGLCTLYKLGGAEVYTGGRNVVPSKLKELIYGNKL
jgi:hypothetical protein